MTPIPAILDKVINDAGRAEAGFPSERSDCTVRALAVATGWSYARAWTIANEAGRKNRRGFILRTLVREAKLHGLKIETYRRFRSRKPQVRTFCRKHPIGRYILHVSRHATGVVDGQVVDLLDNINGRRVYEYWKIIVDENN